MIRITYIIGCLIILSTYSQATVRNVVTNSGFEILSDNTTRPPCWKVGFMDSPEEYLQNGSWSLDTAHKSEGERSIKLEPATDEGYMLSQIMHAPTYDLDGKTVHIQADIRHTGLTTPPMVVVGAPNPCIEPEPGDDIGFAGLAFLQATGPEDSFQTYEAEFTATDEASFIFIFLSVSGNVGAAWFDNVCVQMDITDPGPNPDPVTSPVKNRTFNLAFTQENPINISEKAMEEQIIKISGAAEVVHLFSHVRWTEITGENIEWGHQDLLAQSEIAKKNDLDIMLSFDFTHEDNNNYNVIKTPAGKIVGNLNNTIVSQAYKNELYKLCELIRPKYVFVGIETSFFYETHPDQWDSYVRMFKEIAQFLTMNYPGIHVSAYSDLDFLVDIDGTIKWGNANVWKQLQPELQSIAYSTYPEVASLESVTLPPGYFSKVQQIAPELPVIIPEFGVPGGEDAQISIDDQVTLLRRIFQELSEISVELVCWFSMYDQSLLGIPEWMKIAFHSIGMHTQDGTPKPAWAIWKAVHALSQTTIRQDYPLVSDHIELLQNYPNPFNSYSVIRYQLSEISRVTMDVFDVNGRRITQLMDDEQPAGCYQVQLDGSSLASGVYFYRIEATGAGHHFMDIRKMMMIK